MSGPRLRSQLRCSADTVWARSWVCKSYHCRSVHLSLPTSPCSSPHPPVRSVLGQPAHQPYRPVSHGASGAVQQDATHTVSSRYPFSVDDTSKGQRYRLTCSTSVVQPGGLCVRGTVLPTPSFRAATLPDICLHSKTTLCYARMQSSLAPALGLSRHCRSSLPCPAEPRHDPLAE